MTTTKFIPQITRKRILLSLFYLSILFTIVVRADIFKRNIVWVEFHKHIFNQKGNFWIVVINFIAIVTNVRTASMYGTTIIIVSSF